MVKSIREQNKEKKQQAILASALEIFAQKGYAQAKIINIARSANVGKGTIYEYYRSKEDLFFGVFEWYVQDLAGHCIVDASRLGGNAADRLYTLMDSLFSAALKQVDSFAVFFEFWAAAGNPNLRDRFRTSLLSMYDTFRILIAKLVKEGKESGIFNADTDEKAVAAGLVGAMDGMMLQAWMERDFDAHRAATQFFNIVIQGIQSNNNPGE